MTTGLIQVYVHIYSRKFNKLLKVFQDKILVCSVQPEHGDVLYKVKEYI